MITRNLAVELGSKGITINNVAPGAIATPINHDLLNNPELLKKVTNNIPLGAFGRTRRRFRYRSRLDVVATTEGTSATRYIAFLLLMKLNTSRVRHFMLMEVCCGIIKNSKGEQYFKLNKT